MTTPDPLNGEFFVSGEPLADSEQLWLTLSTMKQFVAKWNDQAAEYRKRRMFDFAQEAGSFADELKATITHIEADCAANARYIGTCLDKVCRCMESALASEQPKPLIVLAIKKLNKVLGRPPDAERDKP